MGSVKVFGILLGVLSVSFAKSEASCMNYRNVRGECVVIKECQTLYSILLHRPIKSEDADHLRRSQCGGVGPMSKVCCPLEETVPQGAYDAAHPADSPLLPSLDKCGIDSPDKIIGGTVAGLLEFPWMVLVEYDTGNNRTGFHCGGVLINSRYILTASHCINGREIPKYWKLISVRLGEYNTNNQTDCVNNGIKKICAPPPIDVPVEETIPHEMYNPYSTTKYHDIGLLRLSRDVTITAYVKPICLPKTSFLQSTTFTGKNLTVAGWGVTETGQNSPVKLKLIVPVKSEAECSSTYQRAGIALKSAQMCAGGLQDKDSCKGDSGSPLMGVHADETGELNWYSIGVVSFGPSPCGTKNWPGVYTKVANYVPWIVGKLRP